jgi:hypothetical protein
VKHISSYFDKIEEAEQRFAFLPTRSTFSRKFIWLKHYIQLNIFYDHMGKPPVKDNKWVLIYTAEEYTYYCLRK